MYSEVLAQIDRNTERYMVDEMKQEVEELKQELIDSARNLFLNGASYQLVRDSIKSISDEELKRIYDEVTAQK